MFYPSSKHHFDIMFVIFCVIAGAFSHGISNTSKTSINQLTNHYRASFIDFILDAGLSEPLRPTHMINKDLAVEHSSDYKSTSTRTRKSSTICALLSNFLNASQMKFCFRHQDVLNIVLPQVLHLTKKECSRITTGTRWNCTAFDFLLDRSNPLAFTKEAALVRSLLNASMMYLVAKTCTEFSNYSCGCLNNQFYTYKADELSKTRSLIPVEEQNELIDFNHTSTLRVDHQDLSSDDLLKLLNGSPIRLNKLVNRRSGCSTNTAFADAFTRVFIDSEDTKALNKASKILNDDQSLRRTKILNVRRLIDSDLKDLAYIKWTKSAMNIHNNHVGRQMVREATQRRCRCHGLSGVCQFQTCWNQLLDFDVITSRLKLVYLYNANKAEVKNHGTLEKPDLYLIRTTPEILFKSTVNDSSAANNLEIESPNNSSALLTNHSTISTAQQPSLLERVKSTELIYLYESPEYCEPEPHTSHPGTRGRACVPLINVTVSKETSKKSTRVLREDENEYTNKKTVSLDSVPGSCELICCNRGYRRELVLDMVTCNCRFEFCCNVECEYCLRQRIQHFCL